MPDLVYVNGRILPPDQARISARDRGFLYGEGLFETMRAYGGEVFRMAQHLQRYRRSADALGFPPSPTDAQLAEAVSATLEAAGYQDAYLRMTVTRGVGGKLGGEPAQGPTVVVNVRRLIPYPDRLYQQGANLIVSRHRRDAASPLAQHKTLDYLLPILARKEAKARGADDALLLNTGGELAEATVSNVFLVRGGTVLTPPLAAGALPGVTRAAVLEICRNGGLSCQGAALSMADVEKADECFLTNTLMELMPVATVEKQVISKDVPGPVTQRISHLYRELVAARA